MKNPEKDHDNNNENTNTENLRISGDTEKSGDAERSLLRRAEVFFKNHSKVVAGGISGFIFFAGLFNIGVAAYKINRRGEEYNSAEFAYRLSQLISGIITCFAGGSLYKIISVSEKAEEANSLINRRPPSQIPYAAYFNSRSMAKIIGGLCFLATSALDIWMAQILLCNSEDFERVSLIATFWLAAGFFNLIVGLDLCFQGIAPPLKKIAASLLNRESNRGSRRRETRLEVNDEERHETYSVLGNK